MSDTIEVYEGEKLTLRFEGVRCIHARACVTSLPAVFKANVEGPWIDPDAASPDTLAALAQRCPSGAITVERKDGGTDEQPQGRNVVQVTENGPCYLRGDLQLGDRKATRLALCRCGASSRKPYCDGSHGTVAFQATGEPVTDAELPAWEGGGPLQIQPLPNGPVKLTGPVEVVAGSGRAVRRSAATFLCRCGQSASKPYCDGTHRKAGFEAP